LNLNSYLTLPPNLPEKNLPMVLLVHGGPLARDTWGLNTYVQFLANRGYAVLQANFRGSYGFGKSFVQAGFGEFAGKMHDDLMDAIQWAIKEKIADPTKIAIVGGSYGGYAALVGMTFTPDSFACGIDLMGVSDLEALMSDIPKYWKNYIVSERKPPFFRGRSKSAATS